MNGQKRKHKWKELAQVLECPYKEKFVSSGYGAFRIDNKGLYSYEYKEYCNSEGDNWRFTEDILEMFLSGELYILKTELEIERGY